MELISVTSDQRFRALGTNVGISVTSDVTALAIKYSNDGVNFLDLPDYEFDSSNIEDVNIACQNGQFFKLVFTKAEPEPEEEEEDEDENEGEEENDDPEPEPEPATLSVLIS